MISPDSILTDEARNFLAEWSNPSPYVVAHTSGSTGVPKHIELLKKDMEASAAATNRYFSIDASSLLHLPLSPSYIAGKMMIVRANEAGCRLVAEIPSNNPLKVASAPIQLMAVVPSQCEALIENELAHKYLRNLIVGGAPIAPALEKKLLQMSWRSFATYGMTETCSHVALRVLGSDVYTALPGIKFETDSRECLRIIAPYFSWSGLQTNDVVRLLSSTTFHWLGRADNVINSGGIKLHPEQLEQWLQGAIDYPFMVRRAHHPRWGESPEVVVEVSEAEIADSSFTAGIIRAVNNAFDSMPLSVNIHPLVSFTNSLPRTPNGKLKRS